MPADDKDRALTIRLPESLYEQLKELADEEERTVAGIFRLAARQYVAAQRSA